MIYSWGDNYNGQLGRGFKSYKELKPEKSELLSDKNVIQISCGHIHCLALTSDGKVYEWGKNRLLSKSDQKIILTPIELTQLCEPIKSIHCLDYNFYALTFSGKIFCYSEGKYSEWRINGEE